MPFTLKGEHGWIADETHHFIKKLKGHFSCPIHVLDERLTTALAERTLKEANLSRKKRAKHKDKVAATIILQNYLDLR